MEPTHRHKIVNFKKIHGLKFIAKINPKRTGCSFSEDKATMFETELSPPSNNKARNGGSSDFIFPTQLHGANRDDTSL